MQLLRIAVWLITLMSVGTSIGGTFCLDADTTERPPPPEMTNV